MKERKQAALRKVKIIKMIAKKQTASHQTDEKRIQMMLEEVEALEKIINNDLT